MSTYPIGTPSTGVYDIFAGNSFTPSDVVGGIIDNHSPVNRTTMLNSLGYQVSLIQNFVNATKLARNSYPITDAYFISGHFHGAAEATGEYYSSKLVASGLSSTYCYNESTCICGMYQSDAIRWYSDALTNKPLLMSHADPMYWLGPQSGIHFQYMDFLLPQDNVWESRLYTTRCHDFRIENLSPYPTFTGMVTISGTYITLLSDGPLTLRSSPTIQWSGALIMNSVDDGDIYLNHDLYPLTSKSGDLGSFTRQWEDGYINRIYSWATLDPSPVAGSYDASMRLGFVCGEAAVSTWPVYTTWNGGGTYYYAGMQPGKIMIGQSIWGNPTATNSGYFFIDTDGQVEFYSYKFGSGFILTNFH